MKELRENIKKEIEILKKMISSNEEEKKIEKQKEKLDSLLERYLKELK